MANSIVNFSVTFEQQQEKFQSNLSERKEVIIKIVKNPVKWPTNWKGNYLSYISKRISVSENRWPIQKIKINSQNLLLIHFENIVSTTHHKKSNSRQPKISPIRKTQKEKQWPTTYLHFWACVWAKFKCYIYKWQFV